VARAFVNVLGSGAMHLSSFLLVLLGFTEHIMRPRKFLVSTEEALMTK
jgi:hypothetical protein